MLYLSREKFRTFLSIIKRSGFSVSRYGVYDIVRLLAMAVGLCFTVFMESYMI